MATLVNTQLTLADVSKRFTPDGKIDPIAELLSQENQILEDIPFVEANQPTSHVVTIRTGLPEVYYRSYNKGIPSSKSTVAQITEPMAMAEGRSHIDAKLLQLNGGSKEIRLSEDTPFFESMGQKMAETLFNGNHAANPKEFSGMAVRYSSTSAGNGQNILLAGGSSTDNASVYLVVWDKNKVFCTYPKGSKAGLSFRDLGEESVQDEDGNWYQAARSLFQWDCGLVVKDWRNIVRIANIDISDWIGVTGTQSSTAATNLMKLMVRAIARLPNIGGGKACFYANRSITSGLMVQAMDKSSSVLAVRPATTQFGNDIMSLEFMGIPVRTVDRLGVAESLVS